MYGVAQTDVFQRQEAPERLLRRADVGPAGAVGDRTELVDALVAGPAGPGPALPVAPSCPAQWSPQDCSFAQGYVDAGGPLVYLRHLLEDVLVCEGGPDWSVKDYANGYVSRAQFHPGSWATASRATGFPDPNDPYSVGVNVAWWILALAAEGSGPGGSGGWGCW